MKTRLCTILTLCLLLTSLSLPLSAEGNDTVAKESYTILAQQTEICEPGQEITLTLSLPEITLAGGFMTLEYDASLFTLKSISLLQATDALTLTYKDHCGNVNVLLDSAQNAKIDGAFLFLTFYTSEEIQPGAYKMTCTVPDAVSFYALGEDGSTYPLNVEGCTGSISITAPILPECPAKYLACQETNPTDGKFSVRVCALTAPDAALSRGSYGFTCSVTDQNGTRELTLGGSELLDQIEGGGLIYTAEMLGGQIYTATLNLPAEGEVQISITPYVCLDGQTLYAGTYTLIYRDGTYIATDS
ncbi:MAG: hypothetical protein IJW70_01110 [Clostridia bacterium]|nr:hypothetical protein [Clostridia bacterium]